MSRRKGNFDIDIGGGALLLSLVVAGFVVFGRWQRAPGYASRVPAEDEPVEAVEIPGLISSPEVFEKIVSHLEKDGVGLGDSPFSDLVQEHNSVTEQIDRDHSFGDWMLRTRPNVGLRTGQLRSALGSGQVVSCTRG